MIDLVPVGLGPLGRKMVQYALERECFNIVGAVDVDPQKAGRDLGEFCGAAPMGVGISGSLGEAIQGVKPQVAVVTTVSSLRMLKARSLKSPPQASTSCRPARNFSSRGARSPKQHSASTTSAGKMAWSASARALIPGI